MISVLKTKWWIVTGGILQRLTLRPVLFSIFINNLSNGMGCTFIKVLDYTKLAGDGVGKWDVEASSVLEAGLPVRGTSTGCRNRVTETSRISTKANGKSCIWDVKTATVQERG